MRNYPHSGAMTKISPPLIVDLINTFPSQERDAAERVLAVLLRPPYQTLNCVVQCAGLLVPIGLLEYALRFGSPASVELLLAAGADPDRGVPRPLTLLTMANCCREDGRLEKLEALLRAKPEMGYIEHGERVPLTPLIGLARSKIGGIQRYWMTRMLCASGAPTITANDYELRVVTRLLAEFRAINDIMGCLTPEQQQATKATPLGYAALVEMVLGSENQQALVLMIAAKNELKLAFNFDATAALIDLTERIGDHSVSSARGEWLRTLIGAGAKPQSPLDGNSAFERALAFENHELVEIFIDAGAKPDLASSPASVFEMMRRQGLPQRPAAAPASEPPPQRALTSLDMLLSAIEELENCPEVDLNRLTDKESTTVKSLAMRMHNMAERLVPIALEAEHG